MREQKIIRQELREQKAERLLSQQGKTPGWELPPGYLDRLTDEVLKASAITSSAASPKLIRFNHQWRIAAAAAVVVLALGCWYWSSGSSDAQTVAVSQPDWSDIPTEELHAYVDQHIDDFEVSLLAASAGGSLNEVIPGNDISTEALEDYLEAEGWLDELDVSDLFEENM
ncbi:hypothetical protein [Lewinella sp. LCG006]|uniref:hypothetical protein n=1 Tax=Lewinella sp. LCG006 TaxID=3231911 RepID=UPI0034614D24